MQELKRKKGRPRAAVKQLPIFDSMDQCSAATSIPLRVIRLAKQSGCDAFSSNRIHLDRLLGWIFAEGRDDGGIDWNQRLAEYRAKREKIRLDREEGAIADRPTIKRGALKIMATIFDRLDRFFCYELPGSAVGKSEAQIANEARGQIEKLRETLKSDFQNIGTADGADPEKVPER